MALIESKENLWTLNEFAGHTIRMRNSDGYLCANDMVKVKNGKLIKNYTRLDRTKEFIEELKKEVGSSVIEIITTGANENRGTWVHPRVATHLAMWISPTFSVKITRWIEEWKSFSEKNNQEYLQELCKLEPSSSKQKEKEIQMELKIKYNGKIEVPTPVGNIDLIYSDGENNYIVEIKINNNWKHAMGQILCYSNFYPEHKKIIYLFDGEKNILVEQICNKYDIEVRYI